MRKDKEIHLTVRWDRKHRTYLAAATDLRGIMGTGQTPDEALASVQAAIRQHLGTVAEERPHRFSWHASGVRE